VDGNIANVFVSFIVTFRNNVNKNNVYTFSKYYKRVVVPFIPFKFNSIQNRNKKY